MSLRQLKPKRQPEQELANKDASLDYAKASAQLAEAVARLKTIQKLRKNQ
jgi:F-type H+-transporting ATPase subunit epsilon